jgi:integrase
MPRRKSVPSYRLHKQSGQAIVTLVDPLKRRKDVLLGPYDSPESRVEYGRVIAEWEANGRHFESRRGTAVTSEDETGLSVNELILRFWGHVEEHYRHPDGAPTSEVDNYRLSLRPLRELYGHTSAREFGPLALKAVRQNMIDRRLCRRLINQRVGRIKRMFKWAIGEELVPPAVYQGLQAVSGLQRGRTAASEREPVTPVADEVVETTLPHLNPHVRGMVRLQRLTGMRPGEVCQIRRADLDTSGSVWRYRPAHHKTAWRGKARVVGIGPEGQALLQAFFTENLEDYLFSPRRMMAALRAAQRGTRRPAPAGRGRKKKPKREPGDRYDHRSYAQAVARACSAAGIPHWHPNQLRHAFATTVRRRFGLEGAQVGLGHTRADVTQVYAERDLSLLERVASAIG